MEVTFLSGIGVDNTMLFYWVNRKCFATVEGTNISEMLYDFVYCVRINKTGKLKEVQEHEFLQQFEFIGWI